MRIIDYFKRSFLKYIFQISKSASDLHYENLKSLLPQNTNWFLDIGCGAGQSFYGNSSNQVIGIDLDLDSLKIAKKRIYSVILADLNKGLPIKSNSIDIIYSDQVIEHLINTDLFAQEIRRILTSGGHAIIGTENLASWHNIFALLLGDQPSSGPYISSKYKIGFHPIWNQIDQKYNCYNGHNKVFTFKALEDFLHLHGFEVITSLVSGYYPLEGAISRFFATVDKRHAHFIVFKIRKNINNLASKQV
jgi:SAM-dependent methyltransferase